MNEDIGQETPPASKSKSLSPEHLAALKARGLRGDAIVAAGLYSITEGQLRAALGRDDVIGGAIAIPFAGTDLVRYRLDIQHKDADGTAAKYLTPSGATNRLCIPPLAASVLSDPQKPLLFTEGEFKAIAGCQAGIPTIGLVGVYGWLAEGRPVADLDNVDFTGRDVRLTFDSDAVNNGNVREALDRFASELNGRGALVSITYLPSGENGKKMGLDDFLLSHTADDVNKLEQATWRDAEGRYVHTFLTDDGVVEIVGVPKKDKMQIRASVRGGARPHFADVLSLASAQRRNQVTKAIVEHFALSDPAQILEGLQNFAQSIDARVRFDRAVETGLPTTAPADPFEGLGDIDLRRAKDFLALPARAKFEEFSADMNQLGLEGEYANAFVLFLANTSRICRRPVSVIVRGVASSGKTHLVDTIFGLLPDCCGEMYSSYTEASLSYRSKENPQAFKHRCIYRTEREKLVDGQEDAGSHVFRDLADRGISRRAISVENQTTKMRESCDLVIHGPICFLETTTNNSILDEDLSRTIAIDTDDSDAQTRRVVARAARDAATPDPTREERRDAIRRKYKAVHAIMEGTYLDENRDTHVPDIIIPYAECITPRGRVLPPATRRLFNRLMELIGVIALLDHDGTSGAREISATMEHFELARQLLELSAQQAIGTPDKELIDAYNKLREGLSTVAPDRAEDSSGTAKCFSLRHAKAVLELSDSTARRRLEGLEKLDLVERLSGGHAGKAVRYALTTSDPVTSDSVFPSVDEVQVVNMRDEVKRSSELTINPVVAPHHIDLVRFDEVEENASVYASPIQTSPNDGDEVRNGNDSVIPGHKAILEEPRHLATEIEGAANAQVDLRDAKAWE